MEGSHSSGVPNAAATRKRRSSILKSQRAPRTPFSELEFNVATPTDTGKSRRVSFSRRTGVAEFATNEATTTWKNFYEEQNKSMESSGHDSGATSRQSMGHIGNRIFDNQFQEETEIDFVASGPSQPLDIHPSINNENITQQIAMLDCTADDKKLTAPNNDFELSAFTETSNSKFLKDDLTNPALAGEMSGRIDINFSAMNTIGSVHEDKDDLDEIEKEFEMSRPNVVGPGPFDDDLSQYIEVDLNVTQGAMKNPNESDMSITDTIRSPKKEVSNNLSQNIPKKDWVEDKENIVVNPYVTPAETDNFAINEAPEKVLVYTGKKLKYVDINADLDEVVEADAKEASAINKSTVIVHKDADEQNVTADMSMTKVLSTSIKQTKRQTIVFDKDDKAGDISITQCLDIPTGVQSNKRATIVFQNTDNNADVSMTQCIPSVIQAPKRQTIVFDSNDIAADVSVTQCLPNTVQAKRQTIVFENNDNAGDISITQCVPNMLSASEVKTSNVTVKDDIADMSVTQALPNKIIARQSLLQNVTAGTKFIDDLINDMDMSMTRAAGAANKIDTNEVKRPAAKRQTVLFDNDDALADISVTECISNLRSVLDKTSTSQKAVDYADMSVTQAVPNRVITVAMMEIDENDKNDHLTDEKSRVDVRNDDGNDSVNMSITRALPAVISKGDNMSFDTSTQCRTKSVIKDASKTIIPDEDDDLGDMSVTQALPNGIIARKSIAPKNDTKVEELEMSVDNVSLVNEDPPTNVTIKDDNKQVNVTKFDATSNDTFMSKSIQFKEAISSTKYMNDFDMSVTEIATDDDKNDVQPVKNLTFKHDDSLADVSVTQCVSNIRSLLEKSSVANKVHDKTNITNANASVLTVAVTEKSMIDKSVVDKSLPIPTGETVHEPKKSIMTELLDMSNASVVLGFDDKSVTAHPNVLPVEEKKSDNSLIYIIRNDDEAYEIKPVSNTASETSNYNIAEISKVAEQFQHKVPQEIQYNEDIKREENDDKATEFIQELKVDKKLLELIDKTAEMLHERDSNTSNVSNNVTAGRKKSLKFSEHLTQINIPDDEYEKSVAANSSSIDDFNNDSFDVVKSVKKNTRTRISNEIVKTLRFEDIDGETADIPSNIDLTSPLKKTAFGETSYMKDDKSKVIPSYLKDVSDGLKELMCDLVKPMADSVPFQERSNNNDSRSPSTSSNQVQANLLSSSQVDLDYDLTSMTDSNKDIKASLAVDVAKQAIESVAKALKCSVRPVSLPASERNSVSEMQQEKESNDILLTGELNGDTNDVDDAKSDSEQDIEVHKKSDVRFEETAEVQSINISDDVNIVEVNDMRPSYTSPEQKSIVVFDPANPLNNVLLSPLDYARAHKYQPIKHVTLNDTNDDNNDSVVHIGHLSAHVSFGGRLVAIEEMQYECTDANDSRALQKVNSQDVGVDAKTNEIKDSGANTDISMKVNEELLSTVSTLTLVNNDAISPQSISDDDLASNRKRVYSPTKYKNDVTENVEVTPKPVSKQLKISNSPSAQAGNKSIKNLDSSKLSERVKSPRKSTATKSPQKSPANLKPHTVLTVQHVSAEYASRGDSLSPKKEKKRETLSPKQMKRESFSPKNNTDKISPKQDTKKLKSEITTPKRKEPNTRTKSPIETLHLNVKDENVISESSFTSSRNQDTTKDMSATTVSQSVMEVNSSASGWNAETGSQLSAVQSMSDCEPSVNVVAKIDMMSFMGTPLCEWGTCGVDAMSWRLLHGRIHLTAKLEHRHDNAVRTHVRADTGVVGVCLNTTPVESKNALAALCVSYACEAMRSQCARRIEKAADLPPLLRRCAAVARVAVRWARAMRAAWLRLAYDLNSDGDLTFKVANIPLRSVWQVRMRVSMSVSAPSEVPWPRGCDVSVTGVLSDGPVTSDELAVVLCDVPNDWGHVPHTLWKIFRYLKHKKAETHSILKVNKLY